MLISHIRKLASQTQHSFLDAWLEPLIKDNRLPYISAQDKEKREETISHRVEEAREVLNKLGFSSPPERILSAILDTQLRSDWATRKDY